MGGKSNLFPHNQHQFGPKILLLQNPLLMFDDLCGGFCLQTLSLDIFLGFDSIHPNRYNFCFPTSKDFSSINFGPRGSLSRFPIMYLHTSIPLLSSSPASSPRLFIRDSQLFSIPHSNSILYSSPLLFLAFFPSPYFHQCTTRSTLRCLSARAKR